MNKHLFIKFNQILCYFIVFLPFRVFLGLKLRGILPKSPPKRTMIICNHQSKIDSFLVCSAMPFRTFLGLIPIYFLTAHVHMKGLNRFFLRLLGCVPVYEDKGRNLVSILKIVELMDEGRTVFVFPEGRRVDDKCHPKPGIAYLASTKKAEIIPVHLNGALGIGISDFLLPRRNIIVCIGNPIIPPSGSMSRKKLEEYSNNLLDKIYDLPNSVA